MTPTNDAPVTVEQEAQSLEALSDWLLANDHDMKLPDSVAHDPRDIAATLRRLAALASAPAGDGVADRDVFMRAFYAEIDRQCGIGAGMAQTCAESGLFQINADIDPHGFAEAMRAAALAREGGEINELETLDSQSPCCTIQPPKGDTGHATSYR